MRRLQRLQRRRSAASGTTFRPGLLPLQVEREEPASDGHQARVPPQHQQQLLGRRLQRGRADSSARPPTATRASTCRSRTATTRRSAAGRRACCRTSRRATDFDPITDKVRQVDCHGGFTAAAGHALYTARTYPQEYWNRTAFVTEPTGHLVATFVLQPNGDRLPSRSTAGTCCQRRRVDRADRWPRSAPTATSGCIDWYNFIVQHNPTPRGFKTGKGNAYETRAARQEARPHLPARLHEGEGRSRGRPARTRRRRSWSRR